MAPTSMPDDMPNDDIRGSQHETVVATDGELLMRFRRQRDEGAFELLVKRHCALVFRVCQAVLRQNHDVEDAFQATFLVLVRRAGSLEHYDSIAGWLYKVALRTAIAARSKRASNRTRSLVVEPINEKESDAFAAIEKRELAYSLYEELGRLPEKYRMPIVLCHLNGMSRLEVARSLDTTVQTIKSRLARGRAKLRTNLTRRGIAFSFSMAAGTSLLLRQGDCPSQLLARTTELCTSHSIEHATKLDVPESISNLVKEGVEAMTLSYIGKTAVAALIVAAILVPGTLITGHDEPSVFGQEQESIDLQLPNASAVTTDNTDTFATANGPLPAVAQTVQQQRPVNPLAIQSTERIHEETDDPTDFKKRSGISAKALRDAVTALVEALGDDDATVRRTAAAALESVGFRSEEAIKALTEICKGHADKKLRGIAFQSLFTIGRGSDVVVEAAIHIVRSDKDPQIRELAVKMLGHVAVRKDQALVAATQALADEDTRVRVAAAKVLGQLAREEALHAAGITRR